MDGPAIAGHLPVEGRPHPARPGFGRGVPRHDEDPTLLRMLAGSYAGSPSSRTEKRRALVLLKQLLVLSPADRDAKRLRDLLVVELADWKSPSPLLPGVGLFGLALWMLVLRVRRFVKTSGQEAPSVPTTAAGDGLSLAALHFRSGDLARCEIVCLEALPAAANPRALRLLLARCLIAKGSISSSTLSYYVEYLQDNPEQMAVLRFVVGFCLRRRLLAGDVLSLASRLVLYDPREAVLRSAVARAHIAAGNRTREALEIYHLEKLLSPESREVRAVLAEVALSMGEIQQALSLCEEVLNLDLHHAPTHAVLRRAYAGIGKLYELESFYQRVLECTPQDEVIRGFLRACHRCCSQARS